jgi:hypothetical protein
MEVRSLQPALLEEETGAPYAQLLPGAKDERGMVRPYNGSKHKGNSNSNIRSRPICLRPYHV